MKLHGHSSQTHDLTITVENLNCLFHPELTDLDYILQKAKNLGKYHEKKKCVTEYEFKSMSLFLYT